MNVANIQITGSTSEYGLKAYGVETLRAIIDNHNIPRQKGLKKPELIALIMNHATKCKLAEEQAKQDAEEVRLARVAWEKENLPNAATAAKLISEAFEAVVAAATEKCNKFNERAAKDPADAIRWMCEDVFNAAEEIRQFGGWAKCFEKQAVEPTRTINEVQTLLEEAAERHTNDALSASMYPTNAMQALEYAAKYKCNAKLAKMFKSAALRYKQVAETTDEKALLELSYIKWGLF